MNEYDNTYLANKTLLNLEYRVNTLINKELYRYEERFIIEKLISIDNFKELMSFIDNVFYGDGDIDDNAITEEHDYNVVQMAIANNTLIKEFNIDTEVYDIVILIRIAVEAVVRILPKEFNRPKKSANENPNDPDSQSHEVIDATLSKDAIGEKCFRFLQNILYYFNTEKEVVVMCLKLLYDILPIIKQRRYDIIMIIIECIRANSPVETRKDTVILPNIGLKDNNSSMTTPQNNNKIEINPTSDTSTSLPDINTSVNSVSFPSEQNINSLQLPNNAFLQLSLESPSSYRHTVNNINDFNLDSTKSSFIVDSTDVFQRNIKKNWKGTIGKIGAKRTFPRTNSQSSSILIKRTPPGTPNSLMRNSSKSKSKYLSSIRKSDYKNSFVSSPKGTIINKHNDIKFPSMINASSSKNISMDISNVDDSLLSRKDRDIVLIQCFSCLYRTLIQSQRNRDMAKQMKLHEELSIIALAFQGKPRILEFYIWIIEVMYADNKSGNRDIHDNDTEFQYDIKKPLTTSEKVALMLLKEKSLTNSDNIKPVETTKKKGKGLKRPSDIVIQAVAMIGSNYALETREREIALRLLYKWDDKTIEFKALVIKGCDICDN